MDIAKYIGLFLHKYQYCYLPNLGNFEVKKSPSQYNDDKEELQGPIYEVKFHFTSGSIDDALANFIATNERISIANAANTIREFCTETKIKLAEGHEIVIPGFGKFVKQNGTNAFLPEANIQVQSRVIPYFKNTSNETIENNKSTNESIASMYEKMKLKEPKANEEIVIKPPTVNWNKILLVGGILVIVLGIIIAAFWFFNSESKPVTQPEATKIEDSSTTLTPATLPTDTSNHPANQTPVANPAISTTNANEYKVSIRQYNNEVDASKKVKQLVGFGNKAELVKKSETEFHVTLPINNVDTARSVDSLKRFFNPNGSVFIIQ